MANTDDLPWSNGLTMTVAMNDDQFGSSVACGMCVTFQGTGTGIGTMPIPGTFLLHFIFKAHGVYLNTINAVPLSPEGSVASHDQQSLCLVPDVVSASPVGTSAYPLAERAVSFTH